MSFGEELKSLLSAGAKAKPAPVVAAAPAPPPAPIAPPAPAAPAVVEAPAPDPVLEVAVKISHEPKIVEYTPEPAAPAPKRTPLTDPAGKLCAYQLENGTLIAVTRESIEDPLEKLSPEDKRSIDETEEARIDLAPRSSGRIIFLWETFEKPEIDPSGVRLQKRLANDVARNLASRTRVEFDPDRSANAAEINRFRQR